MMMNANFRVHLLVKDQKKRSMLSMRFDGAVRNPVALSRRKNRRPAHV